MESYTNIRVVIPHSNNNRDYDPYDDFFEDL